MTKLEIEVDVAQITQALERLSASLTDMTALMQDIGEYAIMSTRARFVAGQAPDGTPWAPKSQATIAAYLARGDTPDFRPLFGPSRRLSSEIAWRVGPDGRSVEWGSSLIDAAVQQFGAAQGAFGTTARGGKIPWGDIPARPFLGLSAEDETSVMAILAEYLDGATGADTAGD